ncbi:MAG: glycosyltransferase, partial [Candidatus Micrarchaeaceae archaeon]
AETAGLPFIGYEHNRGKGAATRLGMLVSGGNVRVSIDADGSYAPDTISRLYSPIIDENFDISVARRAETLMDHDGATRALGHLILSRSLEKLAPTGVRDTQAGAKAFNKESSRLWLKSCDGYGADRQVLYLARQENLRIAEVPADINVISNSHVRTHDAIFLAKDALLARRLSHQLTPSKEQAIASYGPLHGTARQLSALAA